MNRSIGWDDCVCIALQCIRWHLHYVALHQVSLHCIAFSFHIVLGRMIALGLHFFSLALLSFIAMCFSCIAFSFYYSRVLGGMIASPSLITGSRGELASKGSTVFNLQDNALMNMMTMMMVVKVVLMMMVMMVMVDHHWW